MTQAPKPEISAFEEQALTTYAYLNQGDMWIPKTGHPMRIADMDPEWRYNASRWLEKRAEHFALQYGFGEILAAAPLLDQMSEHSQDAFDAMQGQRERDPASWIRTTALYRALVDVLPTKRKKLAKLADRARHWPTCPARTGSGECLCELIRLAEECLTPEWTV
jgi:hypothetical protein